MHSGLEGSQDYLGGTRLQGMQLGDIDWTTSRDVPQVHAACRGSSSPGRLRHVVVPGDSTTGASMASKAGANLQARWRAETQAGYPARMTTL